jgi:hypothetical protein
VFTGFTLSQTGMVVHWRSARPPRWRHRAAINGTGAVVTALATLVFLVSKFTEGAWVVVLAVPAFVLLFLRIHTYYRRAGDDLGVGTIPGRPVDKETLVIVPIASVSLLTEHALTEAVSIGQEVAAVTVVLEQTDEGHAACHALRAQWDRWDPGVPLHILHTDFASVVTPIVAFIDEIREHDDRQIVVLIPVVIPDRIRYRVLHNQVDVVLAAALRTRPDVVVARVPMPLRTLAEEASPSEPAGDVATLE